MTTSKKGYTITAKIEGQSWMFKNGTIAAESIEDAKIKAIKVLSLTPEHQVEIEEVEIYPSNTKLTVESYPYGRLKTTAFFSVEKTSKGYRTEFQTIDPKTGRIK